MKKQILLSVSTIVTVLSLTGCSQGWITRVDPLPPDPRPLALLLEGTSQIEVREIGQNRSVQIENTVDVTTVLVALGSEQRLSTSQSDTNQCTSPSVFLTFKDQTGEVIEDLGIPCLGASNANMKGLTLSIKDPQTLSHVIENYIRPNGSKASKS